MEHSLLDPYTHMALLVGESPKRLPASSARSQGVGFFPGFMQWQLPPNDPNAVMGAEEPGEPNAEHNAEPGEPNGEANEEQEPGEPNNRRRRGRRGRGRRGRGRS